MKRARHLKPYTARSKTWWDHEPAFLSLAGVPALRAASPMVDHPMTWSGSLRVMIVEDIAHATARPLIAHGDEAGTLEDALSDAHDPMLALAHAVLKRLERVPVHMRPKGMRALWITCGHCGAHVERDARARYCSDACRVEHGRPAKRERQRGKNVGRARCAGHDERGRKCRRYPTKGETLCRRCSW